MICVHVHDLLCDPRTYPSNRTGPMMYGAVIYRTLLRGGPLAVSQHPRVMGSLTLCKSFVHNRDWFKSVHTRVLSFIGDLSAKERVPATLFPHSTCILLPLTQLSRQSLR